MCAGLPASLLSVSSSGGGLAFGSAHSNNWVDTGHLLNVAEYFVACRA